MLRWMGYMANAVFAVYFWVMLVGIAVTLFAIIVFPWEPFR